MYFVPRRHAIALFFFAFLVAGVHQTHAVTLYGVNTANSLVRFDSATPGTLVNVGAITGLQSGENILGIDVRPATGELYALGSSSRLYVINRATAAATFVATLSVTLNGTDFGVDFNPTVDRLRVVSNAGQNLRINPNNGATTVDGTLNPGTPVVNAAAYTNSFNGATTTTLYDIDTANDTLYTQNPPNNGTLVAIGPLGFDISSVNGFDIFAGDGVAYLAATATVGLGNPVLYTVNLATGAATSVGLIGGAGNLISLRGLTAESGTPAANLIVYGVTSGNQLVRFNSSRPNVLLGPPLSITGLQGGENILSVDFRPANGQLYALGSTSRFYTVNLGTGTATQVGSPGAFTLAGTDFGFDFNPLPDRIRVTSDQDQNLRLNPNDGTLTATDGTIAFAAGDPNMGQNPSIVGSAYTNSFAGTASTTLYNIDSNLDILASQNPPNNGTLNTVGSLGINVSGDTAFDISQAGSTALLVTRMGMEAASKLYQVNLATGTATFLGPVGAAAPLRAMAIANGTAASSTVDFDGDRRTDYSIFRPANGTWYITNSSNNSFSFTQFGLANDTFTPGDYDADARDDIAIWRDGVFYVLRSGSSTIQYFQFGITGDEPVARDYDGDSRTDFAIARRTGGQLIWYITNSANSSIRIEQFGLDADVTAPGDYDGDGRFDLACYRATTGNPGTYYVNASTRGFFQRQLGIGGDKVVPGDYDGDGRTDFAFLRLGSQYQWIVVRSSDGGFSQVPLGTTTHVATQGDYDGDGKTDISVWDPGTGTYFFPRSSNGFLIQQRFGQNGDRPVAAFDTH